MNATRWVTLTEFAKHLGRSGIARVDETEKGWFIAWIDNSPKTLAKQEATLKKERATMNDEQRERMLIAEQIGRAAADVEKNESSSSETQPKEEGLKRAEGAEKVVLSLASKPNPAPEASTSAPTGLKLTGIKPGVNLLKRPNVFKTAAAVSKGSHPTNESEKTNEKKRPAPMSMAEKLILEDQERKRRRMDRDNA
jgi:DNA/RNA-binding protein KIN17